ncbi:MAG: S8 family peptidase [Halanaerobiales bacterium]
MKKILFLLMIFVLTIVVVSCSNMPGSVNIEEKNEAKHVDDIFDYSNSDYKAGEILVKSSNSLDELLAKEGSYLIKEWPETGWALVEVPAGQDTIGFIEKMQANEDIILAEPNMRYELHKAPPASVEDYEKQWAFENINAEDAWGITTGSPDVLVGIIDTGVDIDHPEFADKMFVGAYDATGEGYNEDLMYDINGHGTHVTGIAADNGSGGNIAGIAWDCPIIPVRVMDSSGAIYTSYLFDAMIYLGTIAGNNPDKRIVANMSIGGRGYNFSFKDAIDFAAEQGVLLVTSAGNEEKRILSYPSAYSGVVSVAASTPYNEKADFSSEGYWNSVAAPGVRILSTYPTTYPSNYSPGYEYLQGTSMASPFVTGAAALLLSHDPTLSPLEIKNQLEQTANGDGYSEELGYGIIDMEAMLGDLAPMKYGSLQVNTNIDHDSGYTGAGVITIFDSSGLLVTHGTTGTFGSHTFYDLKPGDYTVNLSFNGKFYYDIKSSSNVSITAGNTATVDFSVEIPVFEEEVLYGPIEIDTEESTYDYEIALDDDGYYAIYTEEYTDPDADTTISILNSAGELIAYKDQYLHDRLEIELPAGSYIVRIGDFELNDPLNCILYISKLILVN